MWNEGCGFMDGTIEIEDMYSVMERENKEKAEKENQETK